MLKRIAWIVSVCILIVSSFSPALTQAAQQQVSVSPNVSFILSKATLSTGTNLQSLNFTVRLMNNSAQSVDLNQYGVRVVDKAGNTYAAQLSTKADGNVGPYLSADYPYVSQIPGNIPANQLRVNIFAWDIHPPTYMDSLGNLDVAPALTSSLPSPQQFALTLNNLNPKLPSSAVITFNLVRSYKVLNNGVWSIYTDLMAENDSAANIQLPSNLGFQLKEDSQTMDTMSQVSGGNKVLANQQNLITLRASLSNPNTDQSMALEFMNNAYHFSGSSITLGSISLDGSLSDAVIGSQLNVATKNTNAFDMDAVKTTYTTLQYSVQADTQFTITNHGQTVLSVPNISAFYQITGSSSSLAATQENAIAETLYPNQSASYDFAQNLPKDVDPANVQLVVAVKAAANAAVTRPIDVITLPGNPLQTADSGSSITAALNRQDFDATLSNDSNVSLQIQKSYPVVVNGIPALNIAVLVENAGTTSFKLPSALSFNVEDAMGATYPTTLVNGANNTLAPHQSILLTLQAIIGVKDNSKQYRLNIVQQDSDMNANVVEDTFDLSDFINAGSGNGVNTVNTSFGAMAINLLSTYRLASQSGEDVLMSEVQIRNIDSKAITLPAQGSFYGGYMIGGFDAQGTVVNLQSSNFLYPDQITSVYIYTKIPYTMPLKAGYIYIGDQVASSLGQTSAQTNEWIELPYSSNTTDIPQAAMNTDWTISNTGRNSTGRVVDSQIYDINNQKMLAIRILDTNKETRGGQIVPYTGYISNPDGTVAALKTTDDSNNTTLLGVNNSSITTLWAVLPTDMSVGGQNVVFGQTIDGQTFASPQQYAFTSPTASGLNVMQNVSVYPYEISIQNPQLSSTSNGYNVNFNYLISKTVDAVGADLNRGLEFTLTDSDGNTEKTWNYNELEGTGALVNGQQTLSLLNSDIVDPSTFVGAAKQLNVYEQFAGGTRLLGTFTIHF